VTYVTSLSNSALFSFPDALKQIGELNPKILHEKVSACTHKFRNVESCMELAVYTERLLADSSSLVNVSSDTVTVK
jgi:hypothetical protein